MQAYNTGRYGDVDPAIIRFLSKICAEPNRRLQELVGPRFTWNGLKDDGSAQS